MPLPPRYGSRAPGRADAAWPPARPVLRIPLAWLLLLVLLPGAAPARESDRRQPAEIEADRAEILQAPGLAKYFGDVVFTQGTLRITGATVVVRAPGGRVRRATADRADGGERATVRQVTDAGRLVRAFAHHIEYDATIPRVTLEGNAELLREGERFAAGLIRYWPDSGRVEAGRGGDGGRVRIRIDPTESPSTGQDRDAPATDSPGADDGGE